MTNAPIDMTHPYGNGLSTLKKQISITSTTITESAAVPNLRLKVPKVNMDKETILIIKSLVIIITFLDVHYVYRVCR